MLFSLPLPLASLTTEILAENTQLTPYSKTQYGNILRVRPDNKKSPLLRPANEHKQLIVIDFEYAGANVPGLEFANHFTEWMYNYHDEAASYACNAAGYPTPDQQIRFAKAYVDHRPQYPHASATPTVSPLLTPLSSSSASPSPSMSGGGGAVASVAAAAAAAGTTPVLHRAGSTSSIIEFMLDARAPAAATGGTWTTEDARRDEESDRRAVELLDEARLWRVANSAHWVAWGVVQARVPQAEGDDANDGPAASAEDGNTDDGAEEGFDYLSYAQERAFFFWGDCVLAGLVKAEELPPALRERIKLVQY
jgi:choline kinase